MQHVRRSALGAVVAVASLTCPAVAGAEVTQDFDVSISPARAGVPVTVGFKTGTKESTPGVMPPTVATVEVYFPQGAVYNGGMFPVCRGADISREKTTEGCPGKSILGIGKGIALAPGGVVQDDLTITAVNGGPSTANLFLEGVSPVRLQSNLVAKMARTSGAYGVKLSATIPENMREPAPGIKVALGLFSTKIAGTVVKDGRKRGIVEIRSCKTGTWKMKGVFTFDDGRKITAYDTVKCRPAKTS